MALRLVTLLLALGFFVPAGLAAPVAETPKTVILGFDGMDHALTKQFIDEGLLPNLKRLSEQGAFQPLYSSNPAQSPVAWAVFNTGQNPGKTGVGGFISRKIMRDKVTNEVLVDVPPMPNSPLLGVKTEVELEPATPFDGFAREQPLGFAAAGAAAGLIVGFLLLRVLLRRGAVASLLVGLALGGVGWWQAAEYAGSVPPSGKVPWEINPMQGKSWWSYLDEAGIRLTGIQVAQTYPPDSEGPNTRLLAGLGVKDISGSPGKWFVFTDDPWVFEKGTNSGGDIVRLFFDELDGARARASLKGPANWVLDQRFKERLAALEASKNDASHTSAELDRIAQELDEVQSDYNKWSKKDRISTIDYTVTADREAGKCTFAIGDHEVTLGVGQWSDFLQVAYPFDEHQAEYGLVRFHVLSCDDKEVRIFVPPINIDPFNPPHIPISAPHDFCVDLAEGIGEAYETLGWACLTNPLKDIAESGFLPQSFLDDIAETMHHREQLLAHSLENSSDWDVYYQVFSTTDRIGHMLFREFDPEHPAYDAAYAAQDVTCWGRTFPLGRALPEIYMQVDRIVGGVLDKIESGALGPDCLLMLVADHGFTSFRREVNLNNLLHDFGYLVLKDEKASLAGKGLGDLDWTRTRAYSLGLGKVFINKLGREGKGIVTDAEYDGLCASIIDDLLSVTDGETGPHVMTGAWRRDTLFAGPWVKENAGGLERHFMNGRTEPVGPYDGLADIFVGFAPHYRISWGTGFGGLESTAISNNTNHWSGGHASVDPRWVPGIFFANRPVTEQVEFNLMDVGPTVVQRYGLEYATEGADAVDGKVLPLEGVAK